MLNFYFTTVAIYAIIIASITRLFKDAIQKNGWLDDVEEREISKWTMLFLLSSLPVLRLIIVIGIYMMAMHGPDDDFWKKNG